MATIDQREHLHRSRAAAIDERIQGGANRAACVEHVVDHDHDRTVNTGRRSTTIIGESRERSGRTRTVIAMTARVEHQDRWRRMTQAGQLASDSACQWYSPCRYPDQHDVLERAMTLDDLVREAQCDASQPSRIEQLRAVVELLDESAHRAPVT
jgi:hypothetical protein